MCVHPFKLLFEVEKDLLSQNSFHNLISMNQVLAAMEVWLERWILWDLLNTKNTQEVMTSLSNEAEYK